jgi:sugar/nucleoside kinase (ribokinase family)
VVVTRGAAGCVVIDHQGQTPVPASKVEKVVDTTGAGDLFAAGFLYGYAKDKGAVECARLGGLAAAEVISHYGARPETALTALI